MKKLPGSQRLVADIQIAAWHIAANSIAGSVLVPRKMRELIYRALGIDTKPANVWAGVKLRSRRLSLGHNVMVNHGCRFDNVAQVTLEDEVAVGQEVLFCTTTHAVGKSARRADAGFAKPITVRAGSWIGSRAVILPGIEIGAGCVIAAGAVVVRDCEPNGLYAGNPARRIRDLGPV